MLAVATFPKRCWARLENVLENKSEQGAKEMDNPPDKQNEKTSETGADFERTRLRLLQQSLDALTVQRLEQIGVKPGWHCLEVGAGVGSIAHWLAKRVGQEGRVVATDIDMRFLDNAHEPNLEIRHHNILVDDLEQGSYDLAHTRAVLMHLADPGLAISKMAAAVRPGGWLFLEEFDWLSFGAIEPTNDASDMFSQKMEVLAKTLQTFRILNLYLGRHLRQLLERAGFSDLSNAGITGISRGGELSAHFLLMTLQVAGPPLIGAGVLTEQDMALLQQLLTDPSFYYIDATNFGVWGKRP
jgi:2-polyprenyl-3-methyl-5-hydroxy-6-metoxy-1,4-benzoquinol methylase